MKARTALTVYQAKERQLAIQKKKGTLVDRARAAALVFRLARHERDVWGKWPDRVVALMAAQVPADVEKQSRRPVVLQTVVLQRIQWSWPPCGSEMPDRSSGGSHRAYCLDMLMTIGDPYDYNGLALVGRTIVLQEGFAVSMAFPATHAPDPS